MMNTRDASWQTQAFRQNVIAKINEVVQESRTLTFENCIEMENHVYEKAKTKDEYLGFVARFILHVREMNIKEGVARVAPGSDGSRDVQSILNPIGTSQTLVRQGVGNNQVMRIAGVGSNLQSIVPQQSANPASNLLRSINQQPGPTANTSNMLSMQNRMQLIGMGPGQATWHHGNMGGPTQSMQGRLLMKQMNQMSPGRMWQGQMAPQIAHWQRKPVEIVNAGFSGSRNVTPIPSFLQTSSPSAPSPASLGASGSNPMVSSSDLILSPSPQHLMMASHRPNGMAPLPSSSLNTPGGISATPSTQEDQAYRNKIRQLNKYIKPLRSMITKMGNEGNLHKLSKMQKLLEILSNPTKRVPLQIMMKCEVVLRRLDLKRCESTTTQVKEHLFFSPLLEAVGVNFQSPVANHTLQRTVGPCLEAFFDPEIGNFPPPSKKPKIEKPLR